MRVAEDDLRTHVDELVGEEQAALEHLLMDQDAAFGLGGRHQNNGQQIRRETWPRCVRYGEDGAVDEGFNLVRILRRHEDVVAAALEFDSEFLENLGNDTELVVRHVLDGDFTLGHGRQPDEAADLNHVGQAAVVGTAE